MEIKYLVPIMEKKVVLIHLESNGTCEGHGVIINRSEVVVTVAHIFIDELELGQEKKVGDRVFVKKVYGKCSGDYEATITSLNLSRNIALLKIVRGEDEKLCFDYARIEEGKLTIGQTMHVIHTDNAIHFLYTRSNIECLQRCYRNILVGPRSRCLSPDAHLVQTGCLALDSRFSGAPVFNLEGRIVGLYCLSLSIIRRNFLIPLKELQDTCAQFQPKKKEAQTDGNDDNEVHDDNGVDDDEMAVDDDRVDELIEAGDDNQGEAAVHGD